MVRILGWREWPTKGPTDDSTCRVDTPVTGGFWSKVSNQFGVRQLLSDYLIPVETNSILYLLGGVLAIALGLEILTGFLLSLVYTPDAGLAYGITQHLLATPGWSLVLNFHFYNSYLIFGLVMIHMVRVFITGGYRRGKEGLWLVGVGLAGLTFVISLTGEALHWDEVGFGVPWNISEVLSAVGLSGAFNYTSDALLAIPTATEKLVQIYVLHVSIVPIALGLFIGWHYLLIRFKGISSAVLAARERSDRRVQRAHQGLAHHRRGPHRDHRADLAPRAARSGHGPPADLFLAAVRYRR